MLFLCFWLSLFWCCLCARRPARFVVSVDGSACTGRGARFEGAEHRCVAEGADVITIVDETSLNTLTMVNVSISNVSFTALNGVVIGTYGDIVAMAGWFFGCLFVLLCRFNRCNVAMKRRFFCS